jgi:hypothetical protein
MANLTMAVLQKYNMVPTIPIVCARMSENPISKAIDDHYKA